MQICATEETERQRLKSLVKQPPIIDPNTGLELVIDKSDKIPKDTESTHSEDGSDLDLEYFEAAVLPFYKSLSERDFYAGLDVRV
jgi:hypothetical protein